jgi:cell division protein FtsB
LILLMRLMFAERGLLEYARAEKSLTQRNIILTQLRSENLSLQQEISKIKNNSKYQKKLARDNLGLIEADEYLVLFAKEVESDS